MTLQLAFVALPFRVALRSCQQVNSVVRCMQVSCQSRRQQRLNAFVARPDQVHNATLARFFRHLAPKCGAYRPLQSRSAVFSASNTLVRLRPDEQLPRAPSWRLFRFDSLYLTLAVRMNGRDQSALTLIAWRSRTADRLDRR